VDLEARLIVVRRSYGAETTKGGHEDGVPIAEELLPYLRGAMEEGDGDGGASARNGSGRGKGKRRGGSDWVFAREDGSQHPVGVDLAGVLRAALRKARIVTGYVHKCRRKGCGWREETGVREEEAARGEPRKCPKCGMKLWVVGKVLPFRFHDTRHTTASLLTMFGAGPVAVQRILRHTDIRVTELYTHLAPGWLRGEVDRLAFRGREVERADSPDVWRVANAGVGHPTMDVPEAIAGAAACPSPAGLRPSASPPRGEAMGAGSVGDGGAVIAHGAAVVSGRGGGASAAVGGREAARTVVGGAVAPPVVDAGAALVSVGAVEGGSGDGERDRLGERDDRRTPHPNPLPASRGEGTGKDGLTAPVLQGASSGMTTAMAALGSPTEIQVGARGFEPPASCSQSRRATGLRYAPRKAGAARESRTGGRILAGRGGEVTRGI
jgi:hypothetical protein